MNGWLVLLIVLAVLWLISLLRLGGIIHYGADGLRVTVIAGPARIKVLPAKPHPDKKKKTEKRKKPKTEKKKKAHLAEPEPEDKPGTVSRVMQMLPLIGEAAGALKRKIRVDDLSLAVIWGAKDAAAAAIGYGRANALLGMIWPVIDHNFRVKRHSFRIDLDYEQDEPSITVDAAVTMTVGQLLSFGVRYGLKMLINWSRSGKTPRDNRRQES